MRTLRITCLSSSFALAVAAFSPAYVFGSDTNGELEPATTVSDAEQLLQVFESVLENHVSPPTLQQMAHESIQEIYRRRELKLPAEIASELSEATGREKLRSLLERELQPLGALGSDGMVSRLPHRLGVHSVIVTPNKAHSVNQQLAANRYVGIGIAISGGGDVAPQIAQIIEGGAADLSGGKKGDQIVEVDGKETKGNRLETVIDWIRGPENTDVEIVLRRRGTNTPFTMKRGVVPIKTVQKPIASQSGRTVGIKLDRVSASNVHELRKLEAALDPQVATVILDFRTATGAENLHHGELLAEALLDDTLVGTVEERDGSVRSIRAGPDALFRATPLYVVIDGTTGPVLKWVAAALKDSDQATLVGAPATRNAIVRSSFAIPAGTVTVSVPAKKLGRANGESLSPALRNGSLIQNGMTASDPVMMQRVSHAASMPGYRPNLPLGILFPDPFVGREPGQTTAARRASARANPATAPPLSELLEQIEKRSREQTPAPQVTEDDQ